MPTLWQLREALLDGMIDEYDYLYFIHSRFHCYFGFSKKDLALYKIYGKALDIAFENI